MIQAFPDNNVIVFHTDVDIFLTTVLLLHTQNFSIFSLLSEVLLNYTNFNIFILVTHNTVLDFCLLHAVQYNNTQI